MPSWAALEEVADVAVAVLVLDGHFVTAPAAPDTPLQQRRAVAWHAAGLLASIFCVVVAQHGLDPLELSPGNIRGIAVLHDHFPLRHRTAGSHELAAGVGGVTGVGAAVDEGAGVGGVLEDAGDHAVRWGPPDHVAGLIKPWHGEPMIAEAAQQLADRAKFAEGGENQADPLLDFAVRMLRHRPMRAAHQAHRQEQRQLTAFGLAQQAGGQAATQRVQLDFGDGALQTKQEPAVGRARVVHAIAVADEALAIATQVEQWVPVRAVPRQPGDLVGEDDTDLAEYHARDQLLEAFALCGGGAAAAEIIIDHLDVSLTPAEFAGALAQRILQPQALLVAQHLLRC